jgi:O-antigen/teichoic acid export membrane protein/glycosyltransferase involved in cell wall biosynthesis
VLGAYLRRGSYIIVIFTFSSLLSRIVNFACLPYLLDYITIEEFGMWDAYQMFFALSTVLLSSVASTGLLRFYLLYQDDQAMQQKVIGTTGVLALGMILVFIAGATGASYCNYMATFPLVFLMSVACFPLYAFMLAYCRAHELFGTYAMLFLAQNGIATGMTLWGVSYGYGLTAFFYAHFFSYLPTVLMFLRVVWQHFSFSFAIAQKQIVFIVPLLAYNFLYSSFFTIDRSCLAYYGGFQQLGMYGLLFRFIQIFQFFTVALMDASPNIFFKAQHESDAATLLQKLMTYYIYAIITAAAGIMVATWWAIVAFFPQKYGGLVLYIPYFLLPFVVLECARALQIGFNLSCKTYMVPLLGAISLGVQASLFYFIPAYSIRHLFFVNACAFLCYLVISSYGNYKLYSRTFVNFRALSTLLSFFVVWCGIVYVVQLQRLSLLVLSCIYVVWVICLSLAVIYEDDKKVIFSYFNRIARYCERRAIAMVTYAVGIPLSFFVTRGAPLHYDTSVSKHAYTQGLYGKKIFIVGPQLIPLGGVAVHVDRTKKLLQEQGNHVVLYDSIAHTGFLMRHFYNLVYAVLKLKPDVIIYHTPYVHHGLTEGLILVFLQKILSSKLMFVEHDCRYLYRKAQIYRRIFMWIISNIDWFVYIGNKTYQSHRDCTCIVLSKHSVESAFLPPYEPDRKAILDTYPEELFSFVRTHSPIILINAFQLSLLEGKDLYGFDLCLQAINDLKMSYPQLGCILALGQKGDSAYFDHLQNYINEHYIGDNCFFLMDQKQLWPLFKNIDLFVRPTLSDGAAISIEEALFFSVPVVASDVCVRPQDVVLFQSGDYIDFKLKVSYVLEKNYVMGRNQHEYLHQRHI